MIVRAVGPEEVHVLPPVLLQVCAVQTPACTGRVQPSATYDACQEPAAAERHQALCLERSGHAWQAHGWLLTAHSSKMQANIAPSPLCGISDLCPPQRHCRAGGAASVGVQRAIRADVKLPQRPQGTQGRAASPPIRPPGVRSAAGHSARCCGAPAQTRAALCSGRTRRTSCSAQGAWLSTLLTQLPDAATSACAVSRCAVGAHTPWPQDAGQHLWGWAVVEQAPVLDVPRLPTCAEL